MKIICMAQTCKDLHRLEQTYTDLHRLAQTCKDLQRLAQTCTDLQRLAQTCTDLHRLAQTCKDLNSLEQTFQLTYTNCVKQAVVASVGQVSLIFNSLACGCLSITIVTFGLEIRKRRNSGTSVT